MKPNDILPLIALILLCLVLPAGGAAPTAGISSAAADTTGTPPQDVSVYISEAKAAVAGQNWTQGIVITTRGIAWYPDDPELLCLQGYSYRKVGQYQKSVDIVSRAIPLDPRAVRYANRGYGYLALGNNSAALADADAGITADADYTANYAIRALALEGMGRNTEALGTIETGIAKSPDNAHYWHVKGRILASGRDCAGAAAALEKSVALEPDYTLPYPSFGTAGENLAALNAACTPITASGSPQPTKSSSGWIAVVGCLGAVIAIGMKR